MHCPNCRSANTQTFEMAHLSGASTGSIRGGAYSPGGDVYVQSARIESRSQLAQLTAPPRHPVFREGVMQLGIWCGVLSFFPSYFIIYFALPVLVKILRFINFGQISNGAEADFRALSYVLLPFATVIFILSAFAILRSPGYKKETAMYQSRMKTWRRSVICLRCGNRWLTN